MDNPKTVCERLRPRQDSGEHNIPTLPVQHISTKPMEDPAHEVPYFEFPTLEVSIDPKLKARLREFSRSRRTSQSRLVSDLIDGYLLREGY